MQKLTPGDISTGLYGKILIEFKYPPFWKNYGGQNRISSGDIVGVIDSHTRPSSKTEAQGIVYRVTTSSIIVSFKEMFELEKMSMPLSLCLLPNDVTFHWCKEAVEKLTKLSSDTPA